MTQFLPQTPIRVQDDIRSSFVLQVNPLIPKEKSCHCQALFATIIFLLGIGLTLGFYFTNYQNMQNTISIGGLIGILLGIYALYLLIALVCNKLAGYLTNIQPGNRFQANYQIVTRMEGSFKFYAECYHYQTRHHVRYVTDSNGNRRAQHYTTVEKVVTHTATEFLVPKLTQDESGNIDQVRAMTNMIFIHYLIDYRFKNDYSRRYFDDWWQNFKRRHTFDAHQTFNFNYVLPDSFIPRKSFYVGQLTCELGTWFYISALFIMIWPYSLWVESLISRYDIKCLKSLTMV